MKLTALEDVAELLAAARGLLAAVVLEPEALRLNARLREENAKLRRRRRNPRPGGGAALGGRACLQRLTARSCDGGYGYGYGSGYGALKAERYP